MVHAYTFSRFSSFCSQHKTGYNLLQMVQPYTFSRFPGSCSRHTVTPVMASHKWFRPKPYSGSQAPVASIKSVIASHRRFSPIPSPGFYRLRKVIKTSFKYIVGCFCVVIPVQASREDHASCCADRQALAAILVTLQLAHLLQSGPEQFRQCDL